MATGTRRLAPRRPQALLLVLLLLVLGAVVYWAYWPQPAGSAGATSYGQTAATAGGPLARPEPLQLGKLEPVPEETTSTRNPFRFGAPPPPPAPPPRPAAPEASSPVVAPTPPAPTRAPIPLKFLGTEDSAALGTLAVLGDGKGGVFMGREGDVIDGQYRIVKIGLESIVMEYLDGVGRRTIREGGL